MSNRKKLYYGWIMVLTLSLTETISWGVLYYAFTVFIKPMQEELGWSRAELTGAFSLALILSGIAGVWVGRWLDLFGTRWLMTGGSIAASLLLLAWSAVNNLITFYLIWAGIGLTMSAVLYEPAFAVVARWFKRKRSRALTILTFLAGFASVIFLPLSEWLVSNLGWRSALLALAIGLGVLTIPLHALILRKEPQDLGLLPDGMPITISAENNETASSQQTEQRVTLKEALQGKTFWWLSAAFTFALLVNVAVTVHLVPYLTDHHYEASFAATSVGLIGIMALPGRLIFNLLAERISRNILTAFIFLLQGLAIVVLLTVQNTAGVLIFVALFGAGFGAITPMRAGLIAELYGLTYYARIASVMSLFATAARGVGPFGAGLAFDWTGSYNLIFWILVFVSLLSVVAIMIAQAPRPREN